MLRGERAPKKNDFLVKIFQKKATVRRKKFGQNRVFIVISESSENQFGRPMKK